MQTLQDNTVSGTAGGGVGGEVAGMGWREDMKRRMQISARVISTTVLSEQRTGAAYAKVAALVFKYF